MKKSRKPVLNKSNIQGWNFLKNQKRQKDPKEKKRKKRCGPTWVNFPNLLAMSWDQDNLVKKNKIKKTMKPI